MGECQQLTREVNREPQVSTRVSVRRVPLAFDDLYGAVAVGYEAGHADCPRKGRCDSMQPTGRLCCVGLPAPGGG